MEINPKLIGAALIAVYRREANYQDTLDREELLRTLSEVDATMDWASLLDAAEPVKIPYWQRADFVPRKSTITSDEIAAALESAWKGRDNPFESRAHFFFKMR